MKHENRKKVQFTSFKAIGAHSVPDIQAKLDSNIKTSQNFF